MKFQISFDLVDLDKAIDIALQVAPYASILEIGTLLLYRYGTQSIEQFRQAFPDMILLADTKIIDRGKEATTLVAQAGADWLTVMAGTDKNVIHAVCTTAHALNKKVMIDLLDSPSPGQSALEAKSLGADALLFHKPLDEHETTFLDKWDIVRGNTNLPVFITGKISRDNSAHILNLNPDGIIIGKAITQADDAAQEAQFFKELVGAD